MLRGQLVRRQADGRRPVRRLSIVAALCGLLLSSGWQPSAAQPPPLRLVGEYSFPSKTTFEGTTVGGLSGIAYDGRRGVYYAICDDRGEFNPPRFYTLRIDLGSGGIGGIRVVGVTTLDSNAATPGTQPYEQNDSDLEEIALLPDDTLLITSERDRDGRPWVRRFALDGTLLEELTVPEKFVTVTEPAEEGRTRIVRGVRSNLGFEGLALAPDGAVFYTANEEALAQDGPIATLAAGTDVRIVEYRSGDRGFRPGREAVYRTERIFAEPVPSTAFADNGVSAMLWVRGILADFDLLAMERSFATGVGNDVTIYGVQLGEAEDVSRLDRLPSPFTGRLAGKTPLANMAQLGIAADNLEGLALGPTLPNGRRSLLVISDDNFSAFDPPQVNQFILFELDALAAK